MIAKDKPVLAIGEAMVELAPIGDGVFQRGFAGDTFNTAWQLAQVLNGRAPVGYVSRVGNDAVSQAFLSECVADGLGVSGVSQDTEKTMGLYLIELDGAEVVDFGCGTGLLTERLADLVRDAPRHTTRRHPPRLGVRNLAGDTAPGQQTQLRDLGGFARTVDALKCDKQPAPHHPSAAEGGK